MMDSGIVKDVCYLIGYRQSAPDRKIGIQFVLNWLYNCFPDLEILLIEQDKASNIDFDLPPNCKSHFIYNPGLYNRCWAFNVGVKLTEKNILAFADSDMFLEKEDYLRSFEACQRFEAVNPNGFYTYNVFNTDAGKMTYEIASKRKLWTYAAGLMLMQRQAFENIGGWDERFEGWGVEDNEISHIITNSLSYISLNFKMYHVDHARSEFDGKSQPKYIHNRTMYDEISVLYGRSLARYLEIRKTRTRGERDKYERTKESDKPKPPRFVLACSGPASLSNLENVIASWMITRDVNAEWTLILSDNHYNDNQTGFLHAAAYDNINKIIIPQPGVTTVSQFNSMLKILGELDFDLCFFAREGVRFINPGWDQAYWQVISRTGLGHLCFYDKRLTPGKNLPEPEIRGDLGCFVSSFDVQQSFFTIVPEMLREVGFLDSTVMGKEKLEFLDYSLRSFRLGFNVNIHPYDLKNSNEYIRVVPIDSASGQVYGKGVEQFDASEFRKRWRILQQPRAYIAFNDHIPYDMDSNTPEEADQETLSLYDEAEKYGEVRLKVRINLKADSVIDLLAKESYVPAKSKIIKNSGVRGFVVGIIKKSYNLLFICRMYFLIRFFDRVANVLIKIGLAYKNIDYK